MRVVIVHDYVDAAAPADARDALVQAQRVADALGRLGHDCVVQTASLDLDSLVEHLREPTPQLVFNLVESLGGRGQLIHFVPSTLEAWGIPYSGSPADAIYLTSNKLLAKRWLAACDMPTPTWYDRSALVAASAIDPGRYIIKSVWEHASVGIDDASVVDARTPGDLLRAIDRRSTSETGECFAEAFVDGREVNVAMLATDGGGPEVLPPAEILFQGFDSSMPRIVGYRAKWDSASYEYHHTPRCFTFPPVDQPLLARMARLCERCWQLFGLDGYARVDFRVDRTGEPYVLEVNTNPCLSPDAGYAAALARADIAFTDALARIVAAALRRAGLGWTPARGVSPRGAA